MILKKSVKIAAVLPCRIESTRLLAKPLQKLGDKTILELLILQLKKSKLIDDVVLAISKNTGSDLYVKFAKENNIKFILGNEEDVVGRLLTGLKSVKANVLVRITSENPFIFWEGIDEIITYHLKENNDLTFHGGLPLGSGLEIVNIKALKTIHEKGSKKHRGELSTLYIYERPKKFKISRLEPEKSLCKPNIRLTVDTPQDLWVARIISEKFGNKGKPIPLKNIIKFLDSNPKIKAINSDVSIKYKRYMI